MIYTIVPLGNPGEKYAHTRHNAARIVLACIEDQLMHRDDVEIFIPDTFMNESGRAVSEYLRYHEGRELIIMYDDKDLPLGTIRISHDRGDGGHNGVKSIIDHLGTKEFTRLRIGIASENVNGQDIKPPHGEEVQGFVMGKFTADEEVKLKALAPEITEAVIAVAKDGYKSAMELFN